MSKVLSSSLFKNIAVKHKEVEEEPITVCSKKSVTTVSEPKKVLHSPRRPTHTSPRRLSPKRSPLLQQFYKMGYQNNRYRGEDKDTETPEEKKRNRTESYKRLSAPRK
jgi:hypothetical protein